MRPLHVMVIALLVVVIGCSATSDAVPVITADDAVALLADGALAIDVRTSEEVAEGAYEGAVHADATSPDFDAAVADLDRDRTVVVYCRTGSRSAQAAERLVELGFSDVRDAQAWSDLDAAGAARGPG